MKIFLKVLGIVQPKAVNKKTLQLKTGKTNHKKRKGKGKVGKWGKSSNINTPIKKMLLII